MDNPEVKSSRCNPKLPCKKALSFKQDENRLRFCSILNRPVIVNEILYPVNSWMFGKDDPTVTGSSRVPLLLQLKKGKSLLWQTLACSWPKHFAKPSIWMHWFISLQLNHVLKGLIQGLVKSMVRLPLTLMSFGSDATWDLKVMLKKLCLY